MAYLFQSGSLETSGVAYSLENDTNAIGSTGSITFGAGGDASVYYNDADGLVLDTKTGERVGLHINGTEGAFYDANGFTISTGDAFYIDVNEVLNQTTLGSTVLASSLTSLGTIASLVATTADINGGSVDNATIGASTQSSVKATTLSGSSTLTVDGASQFNSALTVKANQNITLGYTSDTALDVDADALYFLDATNGYLRVVGVGSFLTDIAGAGLSVTSNQLITEGNTVNFPLGDVNGTLAVGMNWVSASLTANRVYTLPACSTLDVGDVLRVKIGATDTFKASISPNAADAIDDLADNVDVDLVSDNSSISLMVVSGSGAGGTKAGPNWKIF
jgi:hypothetical protein|tara:strand:+ start:311 stop:1315 length:1005 start_codon:yes stop_codon:yes gene_type:complete